MNRYRLRVFPGNLNYLESVTSEYYSIDDFRINFFNKENGFRTTIASYPSAVVIIESITYGIDTSIK